MWANAQREAMEQEFDKEAESLEPGPQMMATKGISFMFVWYGLIWSVIEACQKDRGLPLLGVFKADIEASAIYYGVAGTRFSTSRRAKSYSMTALRIWWVAYRRSRFGAFIAGSGAYPTMKWCATQRKTTRRRRLQTPPLRRNLIP